MRNKMKLARLGLSVARVKISERSTPRGWNTFFQKSRLRGYNSTSKSPWLMDQSSPKFFRTMREAMLSCTRFLDFGYLYSFWKYSHSSWKWVQNRAKFSVLFCPKIFWGNRPSNFWTGIYKLNLFPNIWQNFAEIGPRTSKISRWKKTNNLKYGTERNCSATPAFINWTMNMLPNVRQNFAEMADWARRSRVEKNCSKT